MKNENENSTPVRDSTNPVQYLGYALATSLSLLYLFVFLPETHNMNMEEIWKRLKAGDGDGCDGARLDHDQTPLLGGVSQ